MSASAGAGTQLQLHGIRIDLESEIDAFTEYVARAMEPFQCAGEGTPRIVSRLEWVEGKPTRDPRRAFGLESWDRRPDRDLYLAGTRAVWLRIDDFEDLQLAVTWGQDRLELVGRYHFRVGRGERGESLRKLVYAGRLDTLRARRFSTLLYYLVYHPLLWLLARERGWSVLHAGAVASPAGAAVFAGMPGCGKSTLAVAMTSDREWTMLSDNLVLHDGARVYACPELLLLDRASIARVGAAAARLTPAGERRVYERDAYRPDDIELGPVSPAAIFNVGRARETEIARLDPKACAAALEADNLLAKEVRRIAIMSQVLDLVAGRGAPDERAAIARLVQAVPCYQLWVGEGADLGEVVRTLVLPALAGAAGGPRRVHA
jgi:hypothetical protein